MELSLFLAKFFGIYMLIIATIWLTRKNEFEAVVRDIVSSNGLFAFTGILQIIVGLIICILHPIGEWNWRGLVTLLAFLMIVQGVLRLAFTKQMKNAVLKLLGKESWVWILFLIVVGALLVYVGFSHVVNKTTFLGIELF
jgi:hypothetical protein